MHARRIVEIKSGKPATWLSHELTCLYHASVDGKVALCGTRRLARQNMYPSILDPATDIMACRRCLEKVRYAKANESREGDL
jgi:hypothetical protein